MERELEVKLLGLDVKEFEEKLIDLGAELIAREYQKNITINSTLHPIDNKNKGYLRIRHTKDLINDEECYYFTFKEQITNKGIRENLEHTIEFNSEEELLNILNCLGYDIYDVGYKSRVSYIYKKARFDIDTWDEKTYPFPYIEIEVENRDALEKIINELNIDSKAISTMSIAELKKSLKK